MRTMTMLDYQDRQVPEYYPTMYQDGFTPTQILAAAHKKMIADREAEDDKTEIVVKAEVRFV